MKLEFLEKVHLKLFFFFGETIHLELEFMELEFFVIYNLE